MTIETPLYRATIGSVGGQVKSWELHFRGEKAMVLPGTIDNLGLVVLRPGQPPSPIAFTPSVETIKLDDAHPTGELRLVGEDGFGVRVTQVIRFRADSYVMDHEIQVENRHSVVQTFDVAMGWSAPAEWPKDRESFAGVRPVYVVRLPKGSFWPRREHLGGAESHAGEDRWIGFEGAVAPVGQNGVYLSALVPRTPEMTVSESRREIKRQVGNTNESSMFHHSRDRHESQRGFAGAG